MDNGKQIYIDSVLDELERIIKRGNEDLYEKSLNKEIVRKYALEICDKIADFNGDLIELTSLVASNIYDLFCPDNPDSNLIANFALKLFKEGIDGVCFEIRS